MKILIIKPSSFGDIVQANPVLSALREVYPDCNISWLVFDVWQDIVDMFPLAYKKIVLKKSGGIPEYLRIISAVRKEKFDLVIDLQGLLRTAFISRFSGAKKVLGVPGLKELSWLIEKEVFPESRSLNAVNRSLEVVRFLTGKNFGDPKFILKVSDETIERSNAILEDSKIGSNEKLIAVVPFARGKAKQWPLEYFKELTGLILMKYPGYKIIILGTKNTLGGQWAANIADLSGRTDIKTLSGILSKCSLVIGPDTGPVHLASALQVPVIAIFGGSDVKETAPVSTKASIIKKDFKCSPCRGKIVCKNIDCLTAIKPEEVFEAVNKWIK